MGIMAIAAIRVREPGWIDLQFEDGTESPHGHYGASHASLVQFAGNWSRAEWLVLQRAFRRPNEWHETTTLQDERLRELAKLCVGAARLAEMKESGCTLDSKQKPDMTDLVGFEESPMWDWLTGQVFSEEEWQKVHRMMYEEYHKLPF